MQGWGLNQLIRLGIVDDHPVFRLGLRSAFERQRDVKVLWDLGGSTEVLPALESAPVDIVLMDLNLGQGPDGLSAVRSISRSNPGVKVVVVTAALDAETVSAVRRSGARGYVAKDLPVQDIIDAVRWLARPGANQSVFATRVPNGQKMSSVHGLTRREAEVLTELKRGRSNNEIAARLGVSVTTVKKHVQQVLKKLGVKSRTQAVARAHQDAVAVPTQRGVTE